MTIIRFPPIPGCISEDERRQIADVRLADEIDALNDQCSGLEMAIIGANHISGDELNGVSRMASDLVQGLRQLAVAFEAERLLRIAEKRQ